MAHKKNKKSKNNNRNIKLVLLCIILVSIVFAILTSNKKNSSNSMLQVLLNNENISSSLEKNILIENEQIYISYNDLKSFFDQTLYTEEDTGTIITTSEKKLATINTQNQEFKINGSIIDSDSVAIYKDNVLYIALSKLKNVYNFEITYNEKTNIITIDSLNKKSTKAYAKKNLKVKENPKFFSATVEKVKKEDWVYFINEENGYAKIRTQDGIIGWVKHNKLTNFIDERDDYNEDNREFIEEKSIEIDITENDISSFEKRQELINSILKKAINNSKNYVKIIYKENEEKYFERFKIEIIPVLAECGIWTKAE